MGVASLAGQTFRLDPTSVRWDFKTKVADIPTVGGKVVQVYGTEISDMVLSGTFGTGGWREQEQFLERMKELGDKQVADVGRVRGTEDPHRFLYPPKGWDFLVYLKEFSTPDGGQRSVYHSNEIIAPRWTLTLFVVEDNSGLRKVAQDAYISRLSRGLGWKQTAYNGPLGILEMQQTLGGLTIQEYLAKEFGLGAVATGNQEGGYVGPSTGSGGGGGPGIAGIAAAVKGVGLTGENAVIAVAIAMAESSGNPNAHNPTPPDNSYGFWQINMLGGMGPERRAALGISSNEELFNPSVNARAMMMISANGTNWRPWSTFTNGAYRQYMDAARAALA
jgi:hypothetical protein